MAVGAENIGPGNLDNSKRTVKFAAVSIENIGPGNLDNYQRKNKKNYNFEHTYPYFQW
jgi:hypothetical protein